MKHLRKCLGISLIEILVSLAIGIFLVGGLVKIYSGNFGSLKFTDEVSKLQEGARFAIDVISKDLRSAGIGGCVHDINDITNHLNFNAGNALMYDYAVNLPITGTDNTGLNGSDRFTISGATPSMGLVQIDQTTPNSNLTINYNSGLSVGDIGFISDCEKGDIFQITQLSNGTSNTVISHSINSSSTPGNINTLPCSSGHCFSTIYKAGAAFVGLQQVSYQIQQDSFNNLPSLWRSINNNPPQPILDGVENMQVFYGIDTDDDQSANQYYPAGAALTNVVNINNIVSVKISFLLVTEKPIINAQQQLMFNGSPVVNDNLLRKVITTVINLRSLS